MREKGQIDFIPWKSITFRIKAGGWKGQITDGATKEICDCPFQVISELQQVIICIILMKDYEGKLGHL